MMIVIPVYQNLSWEEGALTPLRLPPDRGRVSSGEKAMVHLDDDSDTSISKFELGWGAHTHLRLPPA